MQPACPKFNTHVACFALPFQRDFFFEAERRAWTFQRQLPEVIRQAALSWLKSSDIVAANSTILLFF